MLVEPLSAPVAKQLIQRILQQGSVTLSRRAEQEMGKDNLTMVDVVEYPQRGRGRRPGIRERFLAIPRAHRSHRGHRGLPLGDGTASRYCVEVHMKCPECGEPMTSARENYSYTASGLPYVTLVGVEVRRCKSCGEHEVVLPKIEQLHRAIALAVIGKHARVTAAEVRYLRKYLGWSGADFAKHMGVTAESVSRWENDREQIGPVADRLLRLMVATRVPVSDYPLDVLAEIEEQPAPVRLRVEAAKGGWRAEAGAA